MHNELIAPGCIYRRLSGWHLQRNPVISSPELYTSTLHQRSWRRRPRRRSPSHLCRLPAL